MTLQTDALEASDWQSTAVTASDDELRDALAVSNIPTLLMVVAQLTGDDAWLREPFRPTRSVALNDNDTGGLDDALQVQVRSAAYDAVRALRDGTAEVPAPPSEDRIVQMLSWSLGEAVTADSGSSMAEEAGFRVPSQIEWHKGRPERADRIHVLVVGAGASGIAASITLQRLGIAHTLIEKSEGFGGVWHDNTYPGAGVDTPAHLYSFSFAPNRSWSRYYAKQPEVLAYLGRVADEFDVAQYVRFGTEMTEARWDEERGKWSATLRTRDGATSTVESDVLISCVGTLSEPSVPDLPGLETFTGAAFHSARWDHSVDIEGKRVAVVGTGATAMQIVPAIAGRAARTTVFQRTPQWVVPNANYLRPVADGVRLLMEQVPFYCALYRLRLVWQFQDKLLATLRRDPDWAHPERAVNAQNDRHRAFLTSAMETQLGNDRDRLRERVVPTYPPYSKRILMDNEWITTVRRPDVDLVHERVDGLDAEHVITETGARHQADVVVFATGFRSRRMLGSTQIVGRNGVSLRSQWGDDDASAHLGISVPNFPNLFVVGGPQTTLAHGGSALFVTECGLAYIAGLIIRMVEGGLSSVEVRAEVAEDYDRRVDAEHEQLVWTHPGTTNWYRNAKGRVVNAMPWRAVDYWSLTRDPNLDDYIVTPER
jgi:4-hydroxyacetophenone monooxygenase